MSNNTIKMAIKSMAIDDTNEENNANPIQQMQIQTYDAVKQCGKFGLYGFYGNAPKGSLVIVMQSNGQEECLFGAEDDVNNRPRNLAEGEVIVYNTVTKTYIKLDKNGNIAIDSKNNANLSVKGNVNINVIGNCDIKASNCSINANKIDITGATDITGDVNITGTLKATTIEAGNGIDGVFTTSVTVAKGITTAGT